MVLTNKIIDKIVCNPGNRVAKIFTVPESTPLTSGVVDNFNKLHIDLISLLTINPRGPAIK